MFSESIRAQAFAVKQLSSQLASGRLAHTYLLTGDAASGKEELAQAFAAALNCADKKYFQVCACPSCAKFEHHNHPDIHILGEDREAKSIKMEAVREVIGSSSLKPYESAWKVFVFLGAERLTADASNALLKTLEEPALHSIFILTAGSRANMLETIQSRAFEIRLKPMDGEDLSAADFLREFEGRNWEDYLDGIGSNKENVKACLERLMLYCRSRLKKEPGEIRSPQAYLDAFDALAESKDAIDSNANQKIVLSRLAMRLRSLIPQG